MRWKNLIFDDLITSSKSSIYSGGIKENYLNIGGLQYNKLDEPQILFLESQFTKVKFSLQKEIIKVNLEF